MNNAKTIDPAAIRGRYAGAGRLVRLYVRVKLAICPLREIEKYAPGSGRIADLGCGAGILAHILALGSPDRVIDARDADENKIAVARGTVGAEDRISFSVEDIRRFEGTGFDAVVISDTLYLLGAGEQEDVLKRCFHALNEGGVLIVKEMDKRPLWKYLVNVFQETLAVRVAGLTRGGRFCFRTVEEYVRLLASCGFDARSVRLDRGYAYPHVLFVCRKTQKDGTRNDRSCRDAV